MGGLKGHCSKMHKKGSHVGIIASFSIFVFFLAAIYFITQPSLINREDKKILLESLKREVVEELSAETIIAIISNQTVINNCAKINNQDVVINSSFGAVVKTGSGNLVNSGFDGDYLVIDPTNEQLLWVYYSQELERNNKADTGCLIPKIESVRVEKRIFEKKVKESIDNFTFFKSGLSVATQDNLGLSFTLNNGSVISTPEKELSVNVFVEEFSVQYIDKDANVLSGKLKIELW